MARFARGGAPFVSNDGPVESGFYINDQPTEFLVPNLARDDKSPSGLDHDTAIDALPLVLSGTAAREYDPFNEELALYREFGLVKPTTERILSFANRWGALGSEATCEFELLASEGAERMRGSSTWGEATENWKREAGMMYDAITFWDAMRDGQTKTLEASIWPDGDAVVWRSAPIGRGTTGRRIITAPHYRPERLEEWKKHGLDRAALFVVQDLVNQGMHSRVHQQLQWDGFSDRPRLLIVPRNLIGALWLQFANAIDGEYDYGKCKACSSWFEIAPGSGRPEKRYCSDACRMRAYRQRKGMKKTVR